MVIGRVTDHGGGEYRCNYDAKLISSRCHCFSNKASEF